MLTKSNFLFVFLEKTHDALGEIKGIIDKNKIIIAIIMSEILGGKKEELFL